MTSQSIPIVYGGEAEDSLSTAQHPATRAWCKLTNSHVIPESIAILQERVRRPGELYRVIGKPSVYRLASVGPGGVNVIAKRCESAAAATECSIYENVLSQLPVRLLGSLRLQELEPLVQLRPVPQPLGCGGSSPVSLRSGENGPQSVLDNCFEASA